MPSRRWHVEVLDLAQADLDILFNRNKLIYRAARDKINELELDPYIGESCDPPIEEARKTLFWNPDYRLVWVPIPSRRIVKVIGARLKERDASLFPRMEERIKNWRSSEEEAP